MRAKKYLFSLLLLVWGSCSLISCHKGDEVDSTSERSLLVMSLDQITTRGSSSYIEDNSIEKVRILVFTGGALEANKLFTSEDKEIRNPFVLEVATGTKDIYVVANETGELSQHLSTVTTKEQLKRLSTNATVAPLSGAIPMSGEQRGVIVGKEKSATEVKLTRMVAKVDLKLRKESEDKVILKRISLLHNAASTSIMQSTGQINTSYWDYVSEDLNYDLSADFHLPTLYLYEHIPAQRKDGTKIVVDALYNDIPTRYEVYLNESGDSGTAPYSILRNHHYQFTGTIKNVGHVDGLIMNTRVLPWEVLKSSEEFGADPQLKTEVTVLTDVGTNETSMSNPLSFSFTLVRAAQGAYWQASLDNGLEFEFVDPAQARGMIGETKTLTIRPRFPFREERVRSTQIYVTVTNPANGITQRAPLVGEAKEVTIKQVQ